MSEITRPTIPTTSRIVPIVVSDTPDTVAVTAHLRMAPTAIRTIEVPIPMLCRLPCGPEYHALHGHIDGDRGHLRPSGRAQGFPRHHPPDRRAARRAARGGDRFQRRVPLGHPQAVRRAGP